MIVKVDHIDLKVPNLEAHVAFLKSLGFVTVRETDAERGSVELALPGANQVVFELREETDLDSTVLGHIALTSSDVQEDIAALKDAEIVVLKENHFIEATGRYISNFADPSGASWQLAHSTQEDS